MLAGWGSELQSLCRAGRFPHGEGCGQFWIFFRAASAAAPTALF